MSPEISERAFAEAIECGLLQFGPDACAGDAARNGRVGRGRAVLDDAEKW